MGLEQWIGFALKRRMCVGGGEACISSDTENEQSTNVGKCSEEWAREQAEVHFSLGGCITQGPSAILTGRS